MPILLQAKTLQRRQQPTQRPTQMSRLVLCKSSTRGKYLVSISVVHKEKEPEAAKNDTLNKLPVKATFAFNLGTTGQKAEFRYSNLHFIANKVTLGSNLVFKGADKKTGQTLIEPLTQQSGKDESNAIRFLIQPDFGLTFTPTKVTFKTTRYGTDNGNIDISWQICEQDRPFVRSQRKT